MVKRARREEPGRLRWVRLPIALATISFASPFSPHHARLRVSQLTNPHLSDLHLARNVRKAAARQQAKDDLGALLDGTSRSRSRGGIDTMVDSMGDGKASRGTGAAAASPIDGQPSLLSPAKTSQSLATLDLHASDSAILSHWPTPLLRLLVLLSPVVTATTHLVRLMTWTGGSGTTSHSFLVLLVWWAICLFGYEVLRFAPQIALLTVLGCTGLARAFRSATDKNYRPTPSAFARPATADTINATVKDLTVLADFCSTLWASAGAPLVALLTWQDAGKTLGLAVFLVTSWPFWLLLFSGTLGHAWDVLGLQAITAAARAQAVRAAPYVSSALLPVASTARTRFPSAWHQAESARLSLDRAIELAHRLSVPVASRLAVLYTSVSPLVLQNAPGPHISIFPILSLRVRHLLLIGGTVALTWCAPWAALIRHALWRSAFVRQVARTAWTVLSGEFLFGSGAQGKHAYAGRLDSHERKDSFSEDVFGSVPTKAGKGGDNAKGEKTKSNLTRHEDVVYQFTIFENQRWWMGLDWTAALLPQERPSWADESHNPVSPPSSFSLPPRKVMLTHSPTSSDPQRYTKRLIRWQWVDADWVVAGRDARGAPISPISTPTGGRRTSSSSVDSNQGVDASSALAAASAADGAIEDPSWRDVDTDGWQYGDNGWDKMSKKAGMGRYTRRRRWVRRAILVEVVQTDYHPSPDEISKAGNGGIVAAAAAAAAAHGAPIPAEATKAAPSSGAAEGGVPASPGGGGGGGGNNNLRERLARVAAAGGSPTDGSADSKGATA